MAQLKMQKRSRSPLFDLEVPLALPGVDSAILDPRDTYANQSEWNEKAEHLAQLFITNFDRYTR